MIRFRCVHLFWLRDHQGICVHLISDKTDHFPFGVLSFGQIESDKGNHDDVRKERENGTHTTAL